MRWLVALYKEHGAKLVMYQHGAYYGESKYAGQIRAREWADKFRTWGWKQHPKDEPWKAYDLIAFKEKYDKVPIKKPEFDLLFVLPPFPKSKKGVFVETIVKFLNGIDRSKYPRIKIRYRPGGKADSDRYHLSIDRPDITMGNIDNSIQQEMKNSRLIVQFRLPAGNFLECLYLDKPTVGIDMNDNPTDYVKPFYKDLKDLGVMHDTYDEMTNFINEINIEDWHQEVVKNEKYKNFVNHFVGRNI